MEFYTIDLFSGAGGVTTGIEQAENAGQKIAKVIAAINHDPIAIRSHFRNHPHVLHFVEDIRNFDVKRLPKVNDPTVIKLLWASLECTNHSNAKGGLSRDADSRTLAEHLPPYILEFKPDYIGIENVREFLDWGTLIQKIDKDGTPLFDKNGKPYMVPDPFHKGEDFQRWIKEICSLGYTFEKRILNAADFGAHTSRRRLFIIFAKNGMPIAWPQPTHDKYGKFGLSKWKPVKECLDFSDKGENIFGRKKNLSENTYKRIYAGLVKFIANGDESFLSKYFSGNPANKNIPVDYPAATITTKDHHALIQAEFLAKYHGNGENLLSIQDCCSTITTKDRLGLITAQFIDMQHGQGKQNQSVEEPCGSILTVPKKNLVTIQSYLMNPQYNNKGGSVEDPCFTLIAKMDKRPPYLMQSEFIMNTQYNNVGISSNDSMFSLVASRRHPYLVQVEPGQIAIEIQSTDTEYMIKIKQFMAAFGIITIYMRMLRVHELKRITGLPEDYILEGSQSDQKKFIGNAVPPVLPKVLVEALYNKLQKIKNIKLAV